MKYIDIHTHTQTSNISIFSIQNLFAAQINEFNEPNAFYSIGLHPWHIKTTKIEDLYRKIEDELCKLNFLAIGEIGIDRNIETSINEQLTVFIEQLIISEKLNKPAIIHCVKAYNEIISVKKKLRIKTPFIFHNYNSNLETAKQLLNYNSFLSFGEALFNANSQAYNVFNQIPDEVIFLETDESARPISEIYAQAAKLRNQNIDDLKRVVLNNFTKLFNINFGNVEKANCSLVI